MSQNKVPTFDSMMNPLIQAMKELGGSGTIEEINSKTTEILNLSDDQLETLGSLISKVVFNIDPHIQGFFR